MLAENLFPPVPSEVIVPLAGFVASRGQLAFVGVLVAGTLVARRRAVLVRRRAMGRAPAAQALRRPARTLAHLEPCRDQSGERVFTGRGRAAVLVGRLVPEAHILISVPAGVAGMLIMPFLVTSALGTLLWTGLLAGGGYPPG